MPKCQRCNALVDHRTLLDTALMQRFVSVCEPCLLDYIDATNKWFKQELEEGFAHYVGVKHVGNVLAKLPVGFKIRKNK